MITNVKPGLGSTDQDLSRLSDRVAEERIADNSEAIRELSLPLEEAPKFDYRSHSKEEAVKHILNDIVVHAGLAAVGIPALKALYATITHHRIEKKDLLNAAKSSAAKSVAADIIHDAWDTIHKNGKG
ncbi:MAG: hypothetical protein OXU45_05465 [Candidatus Melainabacteria bacterium]|nr:hypothetical protein [Candidatus Melainabacteria bacterium]